MTATGGGPKSGPPREVCYDVAAAGTQIAYTVNGPPPESDPKTSTVQRFAADG